LEKTLAASHSSTKNRIACLFGMALIFIAIIAVMLGLGMPGVAWVVAMLILLAQNYIARKVGLRFLWGGLGISIFHLITFGPFPIVFKPFSKMEMPPIWFVLVFVVLPFMLSIGTILQHYSGNFASTRQK
jgi:uncharacterized membrane protein